MGIIVKEDDPLTWFQGAPAAPASSAPASKAAPASESTVKESDPLTWFPAKTTTTTTAPSDYDEGYGMMARPTGPTIDALARGDVPNALAIPQGRINMTWLPWTADEGTGANGNISLPGVLRAPLQGLVGGGGWSQTGNLTIDPATNAMRLTPEAASVPAFAASPLNVRAVPPEGVIAGGPQVAGVNPLSPEVAAAADARAATAGPAPSSPVPNAPAAPPVASQGTAAGPQPAGAAVTPPGAATLTPAEVAAYRATAEGNKLLENQRVGEPDRASYVPGVTPNAAEQEQTVNAARELKSMGITAPDASQQMKLAAQANNDARTSYFQDTARSPVDVQRAEQARAEQADADLKATWANKTDADASSVQDAANQILAGPDGKRKAVQSVVSSVVDQLHDAAGNLETDPEILYGVRKHIDDLLSPQGQRETPMAARATASLQTLKDTLDGVIEQAAPGFKQYLKNFSDASKPIDEMQVLQDAEPNLFKGPNATLRYSDFQRFMKNVVDMRNAQGVNPYKSISDDTMQRLWNLRDDLRRSASAQELARAPGSDTASNIIDAMKQYGKLAGQVGMEAAAAHIFGPAGPMMVRGARAVVAPIMEQRAATTAAQRLQQMLYPSNPLNQPPAP